VIELEKIEDLHSYDARIMRDNQLRDDMRIALAWLSSIASGERLKYSRREVEEALKKIIYELLRRGKTTLHPDEMKEASQNAFWKAIAKIIKMKVELPDPHPELINSGNETLLVLKDKLVFRDYEPFWIISQDEPQQIYCAIKPQRPFAIDLEKFRKLADKHQISEKEREERWPNAKTFIAYTFKLVIKLSEPHSIEELHKAKDYAPVQPSGLIWGDEITLEDFKRYWKSFELTHTFIALVGGLPSNGRTRGDIDFLIKGPISPELRKVLEFRIYRMLPRAWWARIHFLYEWDEETRGLGPFTSYLPLSNLIVEAESKPEVIQMSLDEFGKADIIRSGGRKINEQAERSLKEDRIKPFRFFRTLKPTKPALPEQRQTFRGVVEALGAEEIQKGVLISKKFDGANSIIFRRGDRVEIWSEDGERIDKSLPQITRAVKKLKANELVLCAEIEFWKDRQHYPREAVAGQLHSKKANDSNLIANVYTCLYVDGEDLHAATEKERQDALAEMGFSQSTIEVPDLDEKLNLIPNRLATSIEELRKFFKVMNEAPGSEGVVFKKLEGKYYLDGDARSSWVKLHKTTVFKAVVVEPIETATQGIFNYRWAVDPGERKIKPSDAVSIGSKEFLDGGKTFSTTVKARRGDIIEIECETLNLVLNDEDDTVAIAAWAPRFMGVADATQPETIDLIVRRAFTDGVLQQKIIDTEGKINYLPIDTKPFEWPEKRIKSPHDWEDWPEGGADRRLLEIIEGKEYSLKLTLEKGVRPAFGLPGGKSALAREICSLIPDHKTYVEPFCGAAAVFFAKKPSDTEILNDRNPEVAKALRTIRDLTEEDYKRLGKFNWILDKDKFERLRDSKPQDDLSRLHRFLCLQHASYGGMSFNFLAPRGDCREIYRRLPRVRDRLKGVKISNEDYSKMMKFDSSETFWYLDPPYPGTTQAFGETSKFDLEDLKNLKEFCKKLKGKFILSLNYDLHYRELFKDFFFRIVKTPKRLGEEVPGLKKRKEYLISNFELKPVWLFLDKD